MGSLPPKPLLGQNILLELRLPDPPHLSSARSPRVHLGNEAGADTLKHGAEARFLHGLATEEFVEENYLGTFAWQGEHITIEQDQAGNLWLHDPAHNFHRRLHRFNRFIYVYGPSNESAEPIQGSVTFFSDGERIFQFLWQTHGNHAIFPRR